jgi:hypothetical protein
MEVTAQPALEIQIRFEDTEANQITTLAQSKGLTPSELIRRAIRAFLTQEAAGLPDDWAALSLSSFEAGWDNPDDAVYDDWRERYGVGAR